MVTEAPSAADALGAAKAPGTGGGDPVRVWIVFSDLLANRIFFEAGVVDGLASTPGLRLTAVFLVHEKHAAPWIPRLGDIPVLYREALMPPRVGLGERVLRRLDAELDERVGFYPLAIRHSLRHGFHRGRWTPGHTYPFLDSSRVGPLPRWRILEPPMSRWHLSKRRHVPSRLLQRMRAECDAVVVTNPQAQVAMPFLTAARRLGVPTIGYIASWDHPVGKGVVSPHLAMYIVQNETMREDLRRFHGIDPSRVVVTGWPQTDVYHRRRPPEEYHAILRELGLPAERQVVLFAGNAPHNAPYEGRLVSRLVQWSRETAARERFSLLFRPHPFDHQVEERYGAALDEPGVAVQRQTYTELGSLATLLQNVDCVVANAGTILLEALVNDRPCVCVTYDEGAPDGRTWADLNLSGEHYRRLLASDAFERAADFDELTAAIERSLASPERLHEERRRVARDVVGEVDGRAAERVVAAIAAAVPARAQSAVPVIAAAGRVTVSP